jgi:hypothetical protein
MARVSIARKTGSRHLLDEYSEKLERDLYRYEGSPVSSRFPLSIWKTSQRTLLAIAIASLRKEFTSRSQVPRKAHSP